MLGLLLVLIAGCLWWPAATYKPRISWATRWWAEHASLERQQKDLQANELRHNARVVRELASLLRSGQTLETALENLVLIEKQAGSAAPAISALRLHRSSNWAKDVPMNENNEQYENRLLNRLECCVQICAESGAPLAQVLDHLADDLEANLDARRTFDVAMAGPRATTRLLTWLPVVGLAGAILLGIDLRGIFTSSFAGQMSLVLGALLWLANRWWCRWLLLHCTRQAVG